MAASPNTLIVNCAPAEIRDAATYALAGKKLDFTLDDLVTHGAFLQALASDKTRIFNLSNLWEKNLRPLAHPPGEKPNLAAFDEALLMAENDDKVSIATTTVSMRADSARKSTHVHILVNKEFERAMIIGEKPPQGLVAAFKKAGIVYIDRTAKNALERIRTALKDVVGNRKVARVAEAVMYRNDASDDILKKKELTLLLSACEPMYPKYVLQK